MDEGPQFGRHGQVVLREVTKSCMKVLDLVILLGGRGAWVSNVKIKAFHVNEDNLQQSVGVRMDCVMMTLLTEVRYFRGVRGSNWLNGS